MDLLVNEHNKPENMINFCRFCMNRTKNGSYEFLKLLENNLLCQQFRKYFAINLTVDDDLPSIICDSCNELLPKYLEFHQNCLNTYHLLKSKVKVEVEEESESLKLLPNEPNGDQVYKYYQLKSDKDDDAIKADEQVLPDEPKEKVYYERKKKQCTVCGKVVARLDNHMSIHFKDRRYTCYFCDRKITTKGNLTKHLRGHLKIKNFKCHLCIKDFVDSQSLKKHLIMHSGSKDHKCDMCDLAFNQKGTLKYHKMQVHFKKARFLCEICDGKFYIPYHLRYHMKTVHAERPKCEICSKILKNQKSLEIHKRIHGIGLCESEFVCSICNKVCSTKNALLGHIKCHDRPKGRAHLTSMRKAKIDSMFDDD